MYVSCRLADSLIAATATEHKLSVYTRDINHFRKIPDLVCINPIE